MKTLLGFSAALVLAVSPAMADSHRYNGPVGYRGHGDYRHDGYNHHGGRYFYYGGIPYFYPYSEFGFGDPYWYGGGFYGGYGYAGGYPGDYYGQPPFEGRIVDETGRGPATHGARSLPGAVQRQLAERGYYKGGIDGIFGEKSKSALKKFQRDNDLKQTGLIDEESLKALGFGDR